MGKKKDIALKDVWALGLIAVNLPTLVAGIATRNYGTTAAACFGLACGGLLAVAKQKRSQGSPAPEQK